MTGERTAVAVALTAIEGDDEDEQLGLFGEPTTEGGKTIATGKRGPGRPPGARNKRTEKTIAWLLSRYRDPRAVLLEMAQTNAFDLAYTLGCTVREAVQEIRLAAIGVLPYVAKKQPLDVNLNGVEPIALYINNNNFNFGTSAPTTPGGIGVAMELLGRLDGPVTDVPESPDEGAKP